MEIRWRWNTPLETHRSRSLEQSITSISKLFKERRGEYVGPVIGAETVSSLVWSLIGLGIRSQLVPELNIIKGKSNLIFDWEDSTDFNIHHHQSKFGLFLLDGLGKNSLHLFRSSCVHGTFWAKRRDSIL
jgi:hypothetical protein